MEQHKHRIFGEVRATKDPDSRIREFVISTEALDRHGTIVRAETMDLSKFSGTAFYQHDSFSDDPDSALGPAKVWQEGKKTIGAVDFEEAELNPLADKILRKIDRGTLKNASIGFIPKTIERGSKDKGEDPAKWYIDAELMEFSVVNIPSNYQAQLRKAEDDWTEFVYGLEKQAEPIADIIPTHDSKRAYINLLNKKTELNEKYNLKRGVAG